jgi:hypothetical protein
MSLRAKFLRPPLPEALGLAMLFRCRESLGTLDRGPESVPRVDERGRRGRQVVKFCLPMLIVGWKSDDVDYFRN